MKEYGVVERDGAPGNQSARVVLRAPRVAVRVESARHWQSTFSLAMWTAASWWGGSGFIYLPRGTDKLHPALARILRAYDPDYLVDALWTHGDIEALEPGWHTRHVKGWPADPGESAQMLSHLKDQVVRGGLGDDIGANLCSPYYEIENSRRMRVLLPETGRPEHSLATVLGGTPRADFEVPAGLDPLLTLALGLRAGYPSKPPLPLGREVDGGTERMPASFVSYVLSTRQDRTGSNLGGLATAWDLTQTGLVKIGKVMGPPPRPVVVIGSAAEDFALAVALDRMSGPTLWVPVEWVQDSGLRWQVQYGYDRLRNAGHSFGRPPIVTSISLSGEELGAVVQASWPEPVQVWDDEGNSLRPDSDTPEVVPAEQLDLTAPTHLACAGDYDLWFPSPTQADGRGGFEFVLPIPAYTPSCEQLRRPQRPFWEVDVEVNPVRMPPGRSLRAQALLADSDAYLSTVLRSGRDGISFNPMSMGLVLGGATLTQSVARPRLRVLGLRGWIGALVAQDQPDVDVQLSQAGRRAMILTRLWGSRSAVARDLLALNDFFREFKPSGSSDTAAYPNHDGVRLTPTEGYLTLAAAVRTLPMEKDEIRERLNDLLHINVLHRGLIVPCSECERRAFYRIELLAERNTCPRCGASAYMTAAWRSEQQEPEWFYDLHGAVRELLEQDGDVPFLAGLALAASARSFEDIAELDFLRPSEDPAEIDIVALMDGRLVIGEAKCVASLGSNKDTNRTITKLIHVSDLLGADEIMLATTAPGPWAIRETDQLLKRTARYRWRFGKVPQVRVLTDLRHEPQNDLLLNRTGA